MRSREGHRGVNQDVKIISEELRKTCLSGSEKRFAVNYCD